MKKSKNVITKNTEQRFELYLKYQQYDERKEVKMENCEIKNTT